MRIGVGFVVVVMALAGGASADEQWLGFSGDRPFSEARVEIGRTGVETVEFDLVIPGVSVEQVSTEAGEFTRLEVPGLGRIGGTGEPMLPSLRRFVEIPLGATAEVTTTVLDRATVNLASESLPTRLYPVQMPMPKCDCDEAANWRFSFEPKAYQAMIERRAPMLAGPYGLRDHRMLMLTAPPAAYDPAAGTVEIATRMRVTVTISGGDAAATAAVKERLSSRHYDAFLGAAAVNLNFTDAGGWAYPDDAPVEFLIITPPQFVADLQPFVEWKTSTGYNVSVVTTDVTGTTTTAIKSYLTGLYNGPTPPVYILMIGDSPAPLATYTPSGGGTGGTDLPYVQMDADLYPDMMIARWPIDDATELANMRDKILFYEQPTAGNSAWLNRALYLAGSGYQGTVTTHEEVIAQVMEPAPNSAECDLWYDSNSPTTSQLIADLNTGRAWTVYSAHCGPSGMVGDPPFNSPDVPNLANADMYPIGVGHCCQSNMWATNADVFGEVTVTQPDKGFVSYWGASNSSYWDEDDWLEKGFFDALFDADIAGNIGDWDGLYSNIAACYAGLSEVTMQNGDESYYWPMYNLNGDPTLDPFTKFPIAMTVGAPPVVPPVADTFTVTVSDGAVGPVPLAMVGVSQGGALLGAGFTDATGTAAFPIDAPAPGSDLLVRVTAHNHLPTDATTVVAAGSDGVVVLDSTIYRCDSLVTIDVFDEDLDGAPPFNVTLSAAPSGGSVPVQVSNLGTPGVVQFRGTAQLGTNLVAAHGDVLTVTYNDADTGSGSPGVKTDTAVLDCAGPVVSNVQFTTGLGSLTLTFDTDEAGTTEVLFGTSLPPSTLVVSPGMETTHSVVIDGTDPCTTYFFEIHTADALGNLTIDDNGGDYFAFATGGQAGVVEDATDTPVAIPDNNPTGASSFITIDSVFPILDVDVLVNITHTYTGDLELLLISPVGTTVTLSDRHGGTGEDYTNTVFDDEAASPISGGSAPFSGSYQPDGALSALDGQIPAGEWTFKVIDHAGIDTGNIEGWQLRLTLDAPCGGLFKDGFETGTCGSWSVVVGEL